MAKRPERIPNPNELETHYSFFKWYPCAKCNLDFRRENGFRFKWFAVTEMFLCGDCTQSSLTYANEYVTYMYDSLRNRTPPPAPPMRTINPRIPLWTE